MLKKNGSKAFNVPPELLDDITSRFLLDAPNKILSDEIALCFLMEQAYWFYLDEYVEDDDSLYSIKFENFASQLVHHVQLKTEPESIDEMFKKFREFKHRVPTYGGLLVNIERTHVLLVQGFCQRASWGFPKGKINVNEEPHECAIREVLEETGYDIGTLIRPNVFLENVLGEQLVRLYIISGVPMETEFAPKTKGEIKGYRWFEINLLPSQKPLRNYTKISTLGYTNSFYMVTPFVKPLKEWIATNTNSENSLSSSDRQRHRSNHERSNRNSSPFIPEIKTQNHQENLNGDSHQKFAFKNRGKLKHYNPSGQVTIHKSTSFNFPNSSSNLNKRSSLNFPLAWQNFSFNKRAINETLDRLWNI